MIFLNNQCQVRDLEINSVKFTGTKEGNVYVVNLSKLSSTETTCFFAKASEDVSWQYHRRLSRLNFRHMSKLASKDLVSGLPKLNFVKEKPCKACQLRKQTKVSFKNKTVNSNNRPLQLLHLDLFRPIPTFSLGGKRYTLMIVDDYISFTWVFFLASSSQLIKLFRLVENEKGEKD